MNAKQFKKPKCNLFPKQDQNIFVMADKVSYALEKAGYHEKAQEFYEKIGLGKSLNEVMALILEYVELV